MSRIVPMLAITSSQINELRGNEDQPIVNSLYAQIMHHGHKRAKIE